MRTRAGNPTSRARYLKSAARLREPWPSFFRHWLSSLYFPVLRVDRSKRSRNLRIVLVFVRLSCPIYANESCRWFRRVISRESSGRVGALPAYCLGHIGYTVVPWKRGRGYATRALQLLLPQVREEGLAYVELTTDADNLASKRVIEANGGKLVERFKKPAAYGGAESLRFRILLARAAI